jgi:hypothetical protein
MLTPNQFNESQTRYNLIDPLLRTVQTVFGQNAAGIWRPVRSTVCNFSLNEVEKLFSEYEVEEIFELTKRLIA